MVAGEDRLAEGLGNQTACFIRAFGLRQLRLGEKRWTGLLVPPGQITHTHL